MGLHDVLLEYREYQGSLCWVATCLRCNLEVMTSKVALKPMGGQRTDVRTSVARVIPIPNYGAVCITASGMCIESITASGSQGTRKVEAIRIPHHLFMENFVLQEIYLPINTPRLSWWQRVINWLATYLR